MRRLVYTGRMRPNPAHWLAALRRRKRAILGLLLPAVALAALSPTACAAILAVASAKPDAIQEAHHHHDAGGAEREAPADPTPASTLCPHCAFSSGAANASHDGCATAADQDEGRGLKPASASERILAVLDAHALLPAAHAVPPLRTTGAARAPPPPAVPLSIRHCVLVI